MMKCVSVFTTKDTAGNFVTFRNYRNECEGGAEHISYTDKNGERKATLRLGWLDTCAGQVENIPSVPDPDHEEGDEVPDITHMWNEQIGSKPYPMD